MVPTCDEKGARNHWRLRLARGSVAWILLAWIGCSLPAVAAAEPEAADQARSFREVAVSLYKEGKFAQSAQMYHRAHKLDPQPVYLFNAARAEQRALQLDDAERDYKEVLKAPDISEKMREKADLYVKEIATTREALKKVRADERAKVESSLPPPSDSVVGAPRPVASPWKAPLGWSLTGVCALSLGAGVWLQLNAGGRVSDLNAQVRAWANGNSDKGMTQDDYNRQYDASVTRSRIGQGLMSLGVITGAASAWLLLTSQDTVALLPQPRGASLAMRF